MLALRLYKDLNANNFVVKCIIHVGSSAAERGLVLGSSNIQCLQSKSRLAVCARDRSKGYAPAIAGIWGREEG